MTLTYIEKREIDIRNEIDRLKEESRKTDFIDEVEDIEEKIFLLEQELDTLGDDNEEEYQRQFQEKADTIEDLEREQGKVF